MKYTALVCLFAFMGCCKPAPRVVLYCGQDREFAEEILADFTRETGIRVELRTDTEADKSVSLFEAIVRESHHPRCDVFWNGEVLNTIRLGRLGHLRAHETKVMQPGPGWPRSTENLWHPLAGRARVLIVSTRPEVLAEADRPQSILALTESNWKGRVAIAKPAFGTTAMHAACLFEALGAERAQRFYRELRSNATVLPGNKDVALAVAAGQFAVGFTDTDDAIVEAKRGQPVAIVYPDQQGMGTLFFPNTVSMVKGGPNPDAARRLIDYLLSPGVETRLAEGPSAQIPVNASVDTLPEVSTPRTIKPMRVDFEKAAARWKGVQAFLRNEFARP
jgi:iron(III) transport system substrate-binding protein